MVNKGFMWWSLVLIKVKVECTVVSEKCGWWSHVLSNVRVECIVGSEGCTEKILLTVAWWKKEKNGPT